MHAAAPSAKLARKTMLHVRTRGGGNSAREDANARGYNVCAADKVLALKSRA